MEGIRKFIRIQLSEILNKKEFINVRRLTVEELYNLIEDKPNKKIYFIQEDKDESFDINEYASWFVGITSVDELHKSYNNYDFAFRGIETQAEAVKIVRSEARENKGIFVGEISYYS